MISGNSGSKKRHGKKSSKKKKSSKSHSFLTSASSHLPGMFDIEWQQISTINCDIVLYVKLYLLFKGLSKCLSYCTKYMYVLIYGPYWDRKCTKYTNVLFYGPYWDRKCTTEISSVENACLHFYSISIQYIFAHWYSP